jgi:hypothetical protein
LIRLRNGHPAFIGQIRLLDSDAYSLALRRSKHAEHLELRADLKTGAWQLMGMGNVAWA